MYELKKKIGKVFTSKSVGTGPLSYEKRIYRATVSQRLRNTGLEIAGASNSWSPTVQSMPEMITSAATTCAIRIQEMVMGRGVAEVDHQNSCFGCLI